jgi:hypothetical protein
MDTEKRPRAPARDVIFAFRPIPPAVANDMHTLECPPAGITEALDAAVYAQRAMKVLREIEFAVHDDIGLGGGLTALGVCENRNRTTRAHGLILRRLLRDGSYSAPLGEIFSATGRLETEGERRFDMFRYHAYRYDLKLWIHQAGIGERLVHTAYAIKSEGEGDKKFCYLARLFVAPFEIDQWREPFLETACGRPS